MTDLELSRQIEDLLVAANPRGMQDIQHALEPGYYSRAAQWLMNCKGTVLIGTGFPVETTYETDGPVGAIALYRAIEAIGAEPLLVCGAPLANKISDEFEVIEIGVGNLDQAEAETKNLLDDLDPQLIISIERPGLAKNGRYHNMRGEDISDRCACFDYFMKHAKCPTIAIGDGGNEIGMGNIYSTLDELSIVPAATECDELLIADVSNWGAYGLIGLVGFWLGRDLLANIDPLAILKYLSERGSVDGVTRENTLTEDSLSPAEGQQRIESIRKLTGFA